MQRLSPSLNLTDGFGETVQGRVDRLAFMDNWMSNLQLYISFNGQIEANRD